MEGAGRDMVTQPNNLLPKRPQKIVHFYIQKVNVFPHNPNYLTTIQSRFRNQSLWWPRPTNIWRTDQGTTNNSHGVHSVFHSIITYWTYVHGSSGQQNLLWWWSWSLSELPNMEAISHRWLWITWNVARGDWVTEFLI